MLFKVLVHICNKIDQICSRFLWARGYRKNNFSLVAWNLVWIDKMQEELGLRKIIPSKC